MHRTVSSSEKARSLVIGEWWLLWMVLMFGLLVPLLAYGWGYRNWGPPYPTYVQNRRAAAKSSRTTFDYRAWGWIGDFLWIVLLLGLFWAGVVVW